MAWGAMGQREAAKADPMLIQQAIATLFVPDEVIELRAIHSRGRKQIDAGYFDGDHRAELIEAAQVLNSVGEGAAIYANLNPIDAQLLGRYANRIERFAPNTATDSDIRKRRWMLLDFDPDRPKDTSATDAQLQAAREKAQACLAYLRACGWPDPVQALSGNGVHLDYLIDLPNNAQSTELVKRVLNLLGDRFDDETVKLDRSVFNAGRIVKLYGTVANKGDNTEAAPWRLSRIVEVPADPQPVTAEQLRALTEQGHSDAQPPEIVVEFPVSNRSPARL